MPRRPKTHRPPGASVPVADDRPSARQRGYTWQWEKARAAYLAANPLCAECEQHGELRPATVVDHVTPHRGDADLFWDERNWQSLCDACHNRKTGQGQ